MFKELSYKDVSLIPQMCKVVSRSQCDTSAQLGDMKFETPIYPANMPSVVDFQTCLYMARHNWFYTMHRFLDANVLYDIMQEMRLSGHFVSISAGVTQESYNTLKYIHKHCSSDPEYITLDIANAYSKQARDMILAIKNNFPTTFIIAGNVATKQGFEYLAEAGAHAVKVGIAGGHVCTTRDNTGFYRPMVSALQECSTADLLNKETKLYNQVKMIADGGITCSGDIAKALASGADMVMAGSIFSGYDESAGQIIEIDGNRYKEYYGSASERNKTVNKHVEGRKILVEYKGSMDVLLKQLKENLQSSISYAGGNKVIDLRYVSMVEI